MTDNAIQRCLAVEGVFLFTLHKMGLPNLSRTFQGTNVQAFGGYGALPHIPTKGLSERLRRPLAHRPLETFGRKYLILFHRKCRLEAKFPSLFRLTRGRSRQTDRRTPGRTSAGARDRRASSRIYRSNRLARPRAASRRIPSRICRC